MFCQIPSAPLLLAPQACPTAVSREASRKKRTQLGARMDDQPAHQAGVIRSDVLDNGVAGRNTDRMHRSDELIPNHRGVIISPVSQHCSLGQPWLTEHAARHVVCSHESGYKVHGRSKALIRLTHLPRIARISRRLHDQNSSNSCNSWLVSGVLRKSCQ